MNKKSFKKTIKLVTWVVLLFFSSEQVVPMDLTGNRRNQSMLSPPYHLAQDISRGGIQPPSQIKPFRKLRNLDWGQYITLAKQASDTGISDEELSAWMAGDQTSLRSRQ